MRIFPVGSAKRVEYCLAASLGFFIRTDLLVTSIIGPSGTFVNEVICLTNTKNIDFTEINI